MSCQIGSLTYQYAYLLSNGRECADSLFCKLSWLIEAQEIIDSYIPVGTLISEPEVPACGLTNSIDAFILNPALPTTFAVVNFDYNGNPLVVAGTFTTVPLTMNAVIAALTTASGVQWSYTQISTYEFLVCAPYTQNGDTLFIEISVTQESLIGLLTMNVTLAGGVAPETPEYQTAAMNCISVTQYDNMVETSTWITKGVKCCDIPKPVKCEPETINTFPENIELREGDNSIEEREGGN